MRSLGPTSGTALVSIVIDTARLLLLRHSGAGYAVRVTLCPLHLPWALGRTAMPYEAKTGSGSTQLALAFEALVRGWPLLQYLCIYSFLQFTAVLCIRGLRLLLKVAAHF